MNSMIFSGFGIEIFKRDERYFIRYDAGELAVQFREDEINEDEAANAQKSEESAYDVLLACQRRS
ncbi:hypothetical protein [Rhodoferax antarcticus]|uniref:hypothetical protein n=1 Tax=Rhodoferax antarcticus TaxID=81479 RepID=UPI0012EC8B77|nr:hypothetical protein [Rhodoferax antarcticus]